MEDQQVQEDILSRDNLKKIATDPIITMAISRIKANALIGNLMCDYSIPESHMHITPELLIRLLKPKLPDVSIMQIGPRVIQFEWS